MPQQQDTTPVKSPKVESYQYKSNLKGDGLAEIPKEAAIPTIETMTKAIDNTAQFSSGIVDQAITAIPQVTKFLNERDPKTTKAIIALFKSIGEQTLESDGKERQQARLDIKATLINIVMNEKEPKEVKELAKSALLAISRPLEIASLALLDNKIATEVYGEKAIKDAKESLKNTPEKQEPTYKSTLKGEGLKGLKIEQAEQILEATTAAIDKLSQISPEIIKQSISMVPVVTDLLNRGNEKVNKSSILFFEELGKKLLVSKDVDWQEARADIQETLKKMIANKSETPSNIALAQRALKAISKPEEIEKK